VRWFTVLSAAWVVVGPLLAVLLVGTLTATLIAGAVGLALTVLVGGIGIHRQLTLVGRLDEERHGLREAFDRARLDSLRDGLTGLGNHRAFQEELDEQIAVAKAHNRPFAVLFADVDNLKHTNDARGHAAGDELLRAASRILSANLRRRPGLPRGWRRVRAAHAGLRAGRGPHDRPPHPRLDAVGRERHLWR
jgi:predicted signal transduction protein with EAL and GGDEF domain